MDTFKTLDCIDGGIHNKLQKAICNCVIRALFKRHNILLYLNKQYLKVEVFESIKKQSFKTLVYSSVFFHNKKVQNFNFGFLKNYKNLQLWFNLE